MQAILKVEFVGDPYTITRKDGSTCMKHSIVLREIGGKFENSYAATYFADLPCTLVEGSVIVGALRFSTRNHEGVDYQDVVLQEYVILTRPLNTLTNPF